MGISITVVVCTKDPPPERLRGVIEALKVQTLDSEEWGLIVVDNASEVPLASWLDLSAFPHARIVVESIPGLTPARLAGIRESSGDLLFVDDDNLLSPEYLERSVRHLAEKPWVGAFGGSIELLFEASPPEWTRMFHGMLAERKIDRDVWSNAYTGNPAVPCGAGMIVRRAVADAYARRTAEDPNRQSMDRRAGSLISDGDTDLALTACDVGLGCGQFVDLRLRHVIPQGRLEVAYLERLAYAMAYSGLLLRQLRPEMRAEVRPEDRWNRLRGRLQALRLSPAQRQVRRAWSAGARAALVELGVIAK